MYVHEYYEIPYSTEKSNNMRWEKLKDKFLKNNMSLSICNTRLSKKKKNCIPDGLKISTQTNTSIK